MLMKICAVHDSKVEAFMTPMFFQTLAQAERSFRDAVNAKDSQFGAHPEDYSLFYLGDYDPTSGALGAVDAPVSVALAVNVVEKGPVLA